MCGIAGFLNLSGQPACSEVLERMIAPLRHHGPDEQGVRAEGCAGLPHARLSILDIAGGHQPMRNEGRTIWITFNGEIFNYVELRNELRS